MLVTLTDGVVSPEAYCVRPSVPPTVPRFIVMVLSAAPSVQPVTATVAGLGLVLASEPSLLKVMATVPDAVPVAVVVSDDVVGLAKLALQALVPVLVQVICIGFAAPGGSYAVIELVTVSP